MNAFCLNLTSVEEVFFFVVIVAHFSLTCQKFINKIILRAYECGTESIESLLLSGFSQIRY